MLIPQKPETQTRALYCFVINQLATPGLGSLMGGRPLVGGIQMSLAVIGCILVMAWFFVTMKAYYGTLVGDTGEPGNKNYFIAGAVFFGVSWLWSLWTSISLLRGVQIQPPATPSTPISLPPRITNIPPKI